MSIYLDHAAATPLDDEVLAKMTPYFSEYFHNASALYGPAVQAHEALESARSQIAAVLGAKSSEIIFTAGGTEANNIAIHGIMQKFPEASVMYSAVEHDSVRNVASNYQSYEIPVGKDGVVEMPDIMPGVVLVSVMYANNEIGTIQPIKKIASEIQKVRQTRQKAGNKQPLYLHVDAAQAGNYLDMHVSRLGADLLTINGGKLYGPKQTGALFVKSGIELKSLIQGGGQERNIRSGTENIAGAIGLAEALSKSTAMRKDETARLQELQKQFIKELKAQLPQARVNGSLKHRLPNNLHITIPAIDNETVLLQLDDENIYAAAGSACSASNEEPSHVLKAMGLNNEEIRSSLRFSMGRSTTSQDIAKTLSTLVHLVA